MRERYCDFVIDVLQKDPVFVYQNEKKNGLSFIHIYRIVCASVVCMFVVIKINSLRHFKIRSKKTSKVIL